MSLDTKIAESGSVVNAPSLEYSQKLFRHGTLQYQQVFPNTYGSPIALNASQSQVTFNIPTSVFNLSKSYLMYTITLPASSTGGRYIWTPQDVISEIQHIQFYPQSSGQMMVDLDNLSNYSKIALKRNTSFENYMTNDIQNRLYPSNVVNNVVPAIRNSTPALAVAVPSSRNYNEPAYFSVGALATAVTYDVMLPLKNITDTIFMLDKNLYFGGALTYLKIYTQVLNKIAFQSASAAAPSTAGVETYVTAGAPAMSNLQLMLNVEIDPDVCADVMRTVNGGGLSMIIPYPISYKNSGQSTTQNITIQFDAGGGKSLNKVIHSIWDNSEANDLAYDCSNNPTGDGSATPQKVQQYQTQLNGMRIQNINLDCTAAGHYIDYLNIRDQLRGSVLSNRNIFQWNWHHCDNWDNFGPDYNQNKSTGNELVSGLPLGETKALTWSFLGTVMNNAQYQHYTWAIFTRKLTITNVGVTCV